MYQKLIGSVPEKALLNCVNILNKQYSAKLKESEDENSLESPAATELTATPPKEARTGGLTYQKRRMIPALTLMRLGSPGTPPAAT